MKDWIYHGLTGNKAKEQQVAWTRGLVAAALTEVVALVVRCLPMGLEMENYVVTHTVAIVVLLSFLVFGYLDRWLRSKGIKP